MDMSTLALLGIGTIVAGVVWIKLGKAGSTILLLLIGTAVIGCFVFVHGFQTLNSKTQVATVSCSSAANIPHVMLVHLNDKVYYLAGDRWELNGSVIRVQPWLYWLGVKSGYTMDRLTSQFDGTGAHDIKPVELGGFSLYKMTDLWRHFPLIESAHGSGVIEPCDNTSYNVFIDVNGQMYAERA